MLWTIVKKELLGHMLSFRFGVCFGLCVLLSAFSCYLLTADYEKRLIDYHTAVDASRKRLDEVNVYSFLRPEIHRRPEPLSIFAGGVDRKLGKDVTITVREVPVEASGGGTTNEFGVVFSSLDFVSIVAIVLSLLAVLLCYDAISGEKQQGTLKQMLANPVGRQEILLGKYVGGLISLLVPLSVSFLLGILIASRSELMDMTGSLWVRISLIYLIGVAFLSCFLLLGICVSTRTERPFLSLVVLLFAWVLFVFIVPKGAFSVASQVGRIESLRAVQYEVTKLREEALKKIRAYRKTIRPRRLWASMSNYGDGRFILRPGNPPETVEYYRQLTDYSEHLWMEYARKIWEIHRQRLDGLKRQREVADMLSLISPTKIFVNVATRWAGTDLETYDRFMEECRRYRRDLIRYLEEKKAFSSLRYITEYEEPEPTPEILEMTRQWLREFSRPLWDRLLQYYRDHAKKMERLDLSDMPSFEWKGERIRDMVSDVLPGIGSLMLFNILLFMVAYVSFLRYDVV